MHAENFLANTIPQEFIRCWNEIQEANSDTRSPFFCPEFVMSLGRHRNDIYAAVLKEKNETIGFFPYKLGPNRIAKPLDMCDYQGVIADRSQKISFPEILQQCHLLAYDFPNLLATQAQESHVKIFLRKESPLVRLNRNFESYLSNLSKAYPQRVSHLKNGIRQLERDVGPLRFIGDLREENVLKQILKWKEEKFNNSKSFPSWVENFLRAIYLIEGKQFRGQLSALYAGNELLAAHFGMRFRGTLHWLITLHFQNILPE